MITIGGLPCVGLKLVKIDQFDLSQRADNVLKVSVRCLVESFLNTVAGKGSYVLQAL